MGGMSLAFKLALGQDSAKKLVVVMRTKPCVWWQVRVCWTWDRRNLGVLMVQKHRWWLYFHTVLSWCFHSYNWCLMLELNGISLVLLFTLPVTADEFKCGHSGPCSLEEMSPDQKCFIPCWSVCYVVSVSRIFRRVMCCSMSLFYSVEMEQWKLCSVKQADSEVSYSH